jgi:2-iminobutanoate/2-iminopropanoate deaminase
MQDNGHANAGQLPGCLGARKATAYDVHDFRFHARSLVEFVARDSLLHRTTQQGETMANIVRNPASIAAPAGRYVHGMEVPPNARLLYISGQVGIDKNRKPGATIEKQCELAWKNLVAILKEARMSVDDLVRVNIYLTDPRYVTAYREARDKFIGTTVPASTLLIVTALVDPAFMVEIEAVAAKA